MFLDIVDVVVTPTLVLLVMAAALLFIIMPAAGIVSNGILSGLNGLLEHGVLSLALVLSAPFPFLISPGLHHGLFLDPPEMINATGHAPCLVQIAFTPHCSLLARLVDAPIPRQQHFRCGVDPNLHSGGG
ncbi:hypothetical protein MJ559_01710 [Klebsiella pneumoniae]|nr:hypothetical protein MJ559_01710 [Klebsiella pneumoniae]